MRLESERGAEGCQGGKEGGIHLEMGRRGGAEGCRDN